MPTIAHALLREQIARGTLGPLYVLVGDDDAERLAVAQEFLDSIDEGLRAFNVDRLYGAETTVDDLTDAASTFPMMAPRRIVLVLAAEGLLMPKRESKAAEEAQERLEAFVGRPPEHATVVFVCGSLDRRRRVVKRLLEQAQLVDCGTIVGEDGARQWVRARATQAGVPLDADAVRVLVERAGTDMARLRAGLERVGMYARGQSTITADDVREAVAAGPEAGENFGISEAISEGNAPRALKELRAALDAGAPPFYVLGQVRSAAERQPVTRVKTALDAVFRTDLAMKSSGGDHEVLLQRLVVELCGTRGAGSGATRAFRPPYRR